MLRAADVLCINETEAQKLTGLPVAGRAGPELDAAVAAAAERLRAMVRLPRTAHGPGRRQPEPCSLIRAGGCRVARAALLVVGGMLLDISNPRFPALLLLSQAEVP
jgi:sugar/nucleoside kinase (ribokinase family)